MQFRVKYGVVYSRSHNHVEGVFNQGIWTKYYLKLVPQSSKRHENIISHKIFKCFFNIYLRLCLKGILNIGLPRKSLSVVFVIMGVLTKRKNSKEFFLWNKGVPNISVLMFPSFATLYMM